MAICTSAPVRNVRVTPEQVILESGCRRFGVAGMEEKRGHVAFLAVDIRMCVIRCLSWDAREMKMKTCRANDTFRVHRYMSARGASAYTIIPAEAMVIRICIEYNIQQWHCIINGIIVQ